MSASGIGLQWGDPRLSITTTRKIDPRHAYIAKRLKDAIGAARERISVNALPLPATPIAGVGGHSGPQGSRRNCCRVAAARCGGEEDDVALGSGF